MVMEDPPQKTKQPSKRSSYFETLNSVTSQLDFLLPDLSSSDALFSPVSPLNLGGNIQDLRSADFLFRSQKVPSSKSGYKTLPSSAEQKVGITDDNEPPIKGYSDVFAFQTKQPIMEENEEHRPEISLRTRLFYTKPVWYLPRIHRPAAVHYLQGQPTGTFIVRSSSKPGVLCLSMKHPGTAGGAYIEHFNIIATPSGYRLDKEDDVYSSLDELILHHCGHRETLPCTLKLPHALSAAETGGELQSFAILEEEFWKSPHSRAHSHHQPGSKALASTSDEHTSYFTLAIQADESGDGLVEIGNSKSRVPSFHREESRPSSRHSWSSDAGSDQWLNETKQVYGHRRSRSDANRQIMRYSNEAEQADLSYLRRPPPPSCPPPLPPLRVSIAADPSSHHHPASLLSSHHPVSLESHQAGLPTDNGHHYKQARPLSSDGSSVRSRSTISMDSLASSMGRDSTCSSLSSRQSNSSLPPYPPSRLSEQYTHMAMYDLSQAEEALSLEIESGYQDSIPVDAPGMNSGLLPYQFPRLSEQYVDMSMYGLPRDEEALPRTETQDQDSIPVGASEVGRMKSEQLTKNNNNISTSLPPIYDDSPVPPVIDTRPPKSYHSHRGDITYRVTSIVDTDVLHSVCNQEEVNDPLAIHSLNVIPREDTQSRVGSGMSKPFGDNFDGCAEEIKALVAGPPSSSITRTRLEDVTALTSNVVTTSPLEKSPLISQVPSHDTSEPVLITQTIIWDDGSSMNPPGLVVLRPKATTKMSERTLDVPSVGEGMEPLWISTPEGVRSIGDTPGESRDTPTLSVGSPLSTIVRAVIDEELDLSLLGFRGSSCPRRSWNPPLEEDQLLIEPPPQFKDDNLEGLDEPDCTDQSLSHAGHTDDSATDTNLSGLVPVDLSTHADRLNSSNSRHTDNSPIDTSLIRLVPVDPSAHTDQSDSSDSLLPVTRIVEGAKNGLVPIEDKNIGDDDEQAESESSKDRSISIESTRSDQVGTVLRSSSEWSVESPTTDESNLRDSIENGSDSTAEVSQEEGGRRPEQNGGGPDRANESLPASLLTSEDDDIKEGEVGRRVERSASMPNTDVIRGTNHEGIFQGSRSAMFRDGDDVESRGSSVIEDEFEIVNQDLDSSWGSENANSNRSLDEGGSPSVKLKKGRKFSSHLKFMAKRSTKKVHKKLKPTWSKKLEITDPAAAIQEVVKRLASDDTTRIGAMVESFIKTTVDKCEGHPPDSVLKSIRQFMSGVKNYLFLDQEPEVEAQLEKYCDLRGLEVDAIFEGALHQILLEPLRDQIYLCFIRHFKESGSLMLLDRNFRAAKQKIPKELGIKDTFIPPSQLSMISIKERFTEIQRAFSPIQKLEILLRVVREIYSSVSDAYLGRNAVASMGADDFLPMLIYVLVHCDQIHIEIEVEYMWGLLDPSLLSGEGGYYLTTLSSAICVLKQLEEETECETKGFVTVFVARGSQPGDIIMKTVPVLPTTTSVEVCNVIIQKLDLDRGTPHSIFMLLNGEEHPLESHCSIYKIKTDYESMKGKLCKFCIRPENVDVKWPVITANPKGGGDS